MEGNIVYLDGIKSHLGKVHHHVWNNHEHYLLMQSVVIDGEFKFNKRTGDMDFYEALDEGFVYPAECCSIASIEDIMWYTSEEYKIVDLE